MYINCVLFRSHTYALRLAWLRRSSLLCMHHFEIGNRAIKGSGFFSSFPSMRYFPAVIYGWKTNTAFSAGSKQIRDRSPTSASATCQLFLGKRKEPP